MKLILDTANIEKIKEYLDYLPIQGVTTNPSILKKEGKIDFFHHMKQIRQLIGVERSLHVQVIASDYEGMLADARKILNEIDSQVYIKIPVTKDGLKAIQTLKQKGHSVTATAIYTEMQALLALEAGADFLAPYVNRINLLQENPYQLIHRVQKQIERHNYPGQLLAASFKQVSQITDALAAGADYVTLGVEVIDQLLHNPMVDKAVSDFAADWQSIFGKEQL